MIGLAFNTKLKAEKIMHLALSQANDYLEKILLVIDKLKKEGTSLVEKIMDGKEYHHDPFVHYPSEGGIQDKHTGCRLFFHIHRENEYGHFHTFAKDNDGELVHLILISMNEIGEPIGLATVNRWVTGDKYVKGGVLKNLAEEYYIDPGLFSDARIVEFVNSIFKAFKDEIFELFDERDKWITNYVNNKFNEPFEDREFEVLSFRNIKI